jgi:hypothetical protein
VAEHKERSQLIGDFLREIAALVSVFYPLDAYLQGKFDWESVIWALFIAGVFLAWGIILEGREGL